MTTNYYINKHTKEIAKITMDYDNCVEDPREFFDNVGKMICFHSRYRLGDKHNWDADELSEYINSEEFTGVAVPLEIYDHSGISMSCGTGHDKWDSTCVGIYLIEEDEGKREWGEDWRDKAREYIRSVVADYSTYISGEVMYATLEKLDSYVVIENGREIRRYCDTWEDNNFLVGGIYGGEDEARDCLLDKDWERIVEWQVEEDFINNTKEIAA